MIGIFDNFVEISISEFRFNNDIALLLSYFLSEEQFARLNTAKKMQNFKKKN